MKRTGILFLILTLFQLTSFSQAIYEDERYVPETDPIVLEKLEKWQDLKFGLLMHWGAYSQWGIVESWSICPEDYGWCQRKAGNHSDNYFEYVSEYEGLKTTFNPVKFNPESWAAAAREAGMKYVVFTTKHHDGFSMFDSKYTDYKVTDPGCAFSSHPRSNIAKEIFDAFRNEGLWAGAYFSKPDWHSDYYWDPYWPPMDRNVNYDPLQYPEKWEQFVQFTHNQIMELMTDYGKMDILWLDGGWVAKYSDDYIKQYYTNFIKDMKGGFTKSSIVNQDIRMDELVEKARAKQPGLIVVDRAVHGKNQNYLTPENRVPDKELPYPWESCIISGGGWSHTKNAKYMSGQQGIQMLVDIVAKGGNLLLNVAPTPEGTWQQGAYDLLGEFADWMEVNNEAIYGTRAIAPYKVDNVCMTQGKDGGVNYFYMCKEGETTMPEEITIRAHRPAIGAKVHLLGSNRLLKWSAVEGGFKVSIPSNLRNNPPCNYVWTIHVSKIVD